MGVLDRIASRQGRRDEVLNQELAKALAETADRAPIAEIADNLRNKDASTRSDCIKVLYEIGYLSPELIAPFVENFLDLLTSKDNRMVWGSAIALGLIADLKADEIYARVQVVKEVVGRGSVITVDNGVKILARVAGRNREYARSILPYLLDHLATCRQKEVPQHAENTLAAVNRENCEQFVEIVEKRMKEATDPQTKRLRKVVKVAQGMGDCPKCVQV